jgi:hypothetical protein
VTLRSHAEFLTTEFRNNTGWNGGALWFLDKLAPMLADPIGPAAITAAPVSKVTGCLFDHNGWFEDDLHHPHNPTRLLTKGGAIAADAHHVIVARSNFTRCRAAQGGAIALTGAQIPKGHDNVDPTFAYVPHMEIGESVFGARNIWSDGPEDDEWDQRMESSKNIGSLLGDHLFISDSNISLTNYTQFYFSRAVRSQISFFANFATSNHTEFICPNGTYVKHTQDMWFCQSCVSPTYNLSTSTDVPSTDASSAVSSWKGERQLGGGDQGAQSSHCFDCPFGASCSDVSTVDPNTSYTLSQTFVSVNYGFYGRRNNDGEVRTFPCPEQFCCPNASCALDNQCALNRDSSVLLCGKCRADFTIAIDSDDCVPNSKCHTHTRILYWFIQLMSWTCWGSYWAMSWHSQAQKGRDTLFVAVKAPENKKQQASEALWFAVLDIGTFEVCVYFYQLASVLMPLQHYAQTISKFFYAEWAHVISAMHKNAANPSTHTAATSGWCILQGMSAKTKMLYGFTSPFLLGLVTLVFYLLSIAFSFKEHIQLSEDDESDEWDGPRTSLHKPLITERAPIEKVPGFKRPSSDTTDDMGRMWSSQPAAVGNGLTEKEETLQQGGAAGAAGAAGANVKIAIKRAARREWDSVPQSTEYREQREESLNTSGESRSKARAAFGSAPATLALDEEQQARIQLSRSRLKMAAGLFYSWILFSYVLLSRSTLALLHCVDVDGDDDVVRSYLLYDGETECLASWQWPYYLTLFALLVFPFSPLFLKIYLYMKAGVLPSMHWSAPVPEEFNLYIILSKRPFYRAFLDVCGRQFKQEYWYWSLVLALFRLLMVCCNEGSLNNHPTRLTSSILLVFLCLWALLLQSHVQPFRSQRWVLLQCTAAVYCTATGTIDWCSVLYSG